MEDYDVDMDEEEEGDVFTRKATAGHWWEDCDGNGERQHQNEGRGRMVNSRSWAEELRDVFAPEVCYSGGRTRPSSISVSETVSLFFSLHLEVNEFTCFDIFLYFS